MTATCVKMLRWGQQKARKGSCTKKKQLEEHFANNSVHWQQVSDMAGNEKEHLSKAEFLIKEVHQVPVCFMEGLSYFSKIMLSHILKLLQHYGIIVEVSQC